MPVAQRTAAKNSDTDIFLRLWDRHKLTPTLARHLLRLDFGPQEKIRMHELAERNQQGGISSGELEELDNFLRVGTVLSILQSRARKLLKHQASKGNGSG